ncbi:hypothetical protein C9374_003912 [Naegleria lovaniensis]|uniref:Uncharacterized protein n=1 Tax=Naegleria lovaniensis TaxID=51637 RepID=A0AA88KQE8_NAELO|nr:uncharacterized protein C9374_003912 [Naegleria lovaniensis]KAG2394148.1 hypothetical protein C9374_003912 [Naegleria lovaniensis]
MATSVMMNPRGPNLHSSIDASNISSSSNSRTGGSSSLSSSSISTSFSHAFKNNSNHHKNTHSDALLSPTSSTKSFMKKTNALDGRSKKVDDVMSNLEDHMALLQTEIMQIRDDLRLQRLMAKKYGAEGFMEGEQRLLQMKQLKKEALHRVKSQLGKLDRTIKAGRRITKEFGGMSMAEEKLKDAKELQRKRRKERRESEEARRQQKGENIELGIYSDASGSGSGSSSDTDFSEVPDLSEGRNKKIIFKQVLNGDLIEAQLEDQLNMLQLSESQRKVKSKILTNKNAPKFKGYFNLAHLEDEKEDINNSLVV